MKAQLFSKNLICFILKFLKLNKHLSVNKFRVTNNQFFMIYKHLTLKLLISTNLILHKHFMIHKFLHSINNYRNKRHKCSKYLTHSNNNNICTHHKRRSRHIKVRHLHSLQHLIIYLNCRNSNNCRENLNKYKC